MYDTRGYIKHWFGYTVYQSKAHKNTLLCGSINVQTIHFTSWQTYMPSDQRGWSHTNGSSREMALFSR